MRIKFLALLLFTGYASLSYGLELQPGATIELNISGSPVLLNDIAKDYDNDGVADLLYRGDYFTDADHGSNAKFVPDYHLSYGSPDDPFNDGSQMHIGLNVDYSPPPVIKADFNEDGFIDFFGGSSLSTCGTGTLGRNSLSLHLGSADGMVFSHCLQIARNDELLPDLVSNAVFMQTSDLNADGHIDIVMHRRGQTPIDYIDLEIFLGNGDGTFQQQMIDIVQPIEYKTIPKFRGGTRRQGYVVTLENPLLTDFDADGDLDVVFARHIASRPDGTLHIFVNQNGYFDPTPVITASSTQVEYIAYGVPIRGYTYPDWYYIAIAAPVTPPDIVTIRSTVLIDANSYGITTDFNNDGLDDFIVVDDEAVKIFNGTTTGFDLAFDSYPVTDAQLLSIGDFDGNGILDILIVHPVPEEIGNSSITPLFNFTNITPTDPAPVPATDPVPAPTTDPVLPPTTNLKPEVGTPIEISGTITAVGDDYIQVDGLRVNYTANTVIQFNDVDGLAVGLPVQLKGTESTTGIIASKIEIG